MIWRTTNRLQAIFLSEESIRQGPDSKLCSSICSHKNIAVLKEVSGRFSRIDVLLRLDESDEQRDTGVVSTSRPVRLAAS